jgi:chromate transporter
LSKGPTANVIAAMLNLTVFLGRGLLFPSGKLYLTDLDWIALTWIGVSISLFRAFKVNVGGVIGLSLFMWLVRWLIHIT